MTSKNPVRLRGVTWDHPRGLDSVVAGCAALADGPHPVEVRWEARSLRAFGEAPIAELAEDHDLLVIDHPHVSSPEAVAALLPFDGCGLDEALDELGGAEVGASHRSYRYGGHQWALAIDAAAQVSVHRPDLLADPPRTWSAVLALARRGHVRWPWTPIDAFSSLITVAGAFGWRSSASLDGAFPAGEAGRRALRLLHELADLVPPSDGTANPIAVHEALATDDRCRYSPLVFGYSNYAREGFRRSRIRSGPPPAGPAGSSGSLLGGAGIAVSRCSEHPIEAQRVALHLAGRASQTGPYFRHGGQPAHSAAWTDDRLNRETDGFFVRTREVLESATVRPKRPGWIAFQDLLSDRTHAVLAGRILDDEYWADVDAARAEHLTAP